MKFLPLAYAIFAFSLTQLITAQQAADHTIATAKPAEKGAATEGPVKNAGQDNRPSDELNARLPKWLRFSGQIRLRAEGFTGSGFKRDSDDAYVLERLRLNMRIAPARWLKLFLQGEDGHILGQSQLLPVPPNQDSMDLRLAYIELGEPGEKHFGLRLGRQELDFGEQRLLGSANWINTPRSFDAVRGTWRSAGFRLDTFAGSLVKPHDNQFNEATPGSNIFGVYTVFSHLIPKSRFEPYLFWRRQSGLLTENKLGGIANFGTYGFRWKGKFTGDWDYGAEMAKQRGSLGADGINAWAGHWVVGRTFSRLRVKPRFFAEHNYASGDHNPADGVRGTFDQLFASAHDLYALTDQVGWKNIRHVRVGAEMKPRANLSIGARYNAYWLADRHDALYSAAGTALARSASGTASSYVGNELDFVMSHQFAKRTLFLGGIGHLFPGTFLKRTTPGVGFTYPYLSMNYLF